MEWDYEMKILASHKSPLSCQIHEGHLISNLPGTRNPQQEGKVGENLPPKLIVEDQKEQKGESNGPQDCSCIFLEFGDCLSLLFKSDILKISNFLPPSQLKNQPLRNFGKVLENV